MVRRVSIYEWKNNHADTTRSTGRSISAKMGTKSVLRNRQTQRGVGGKNILSGIKPANAASTFRTGSQELRTRLSTKLSILKKRVYGLEITHFVKSMGSSKRITPSFLQLRRGSVQSVIAYKSIHFVLTIITRLVKFADFYVMPVILV